MSLAAPLPDSLVERFLKAVRDYRMLRPGDKVAIAVSGGKDSFTLLDLFGFLRREHFPDVEFAACKIRTDIT
jgi:tRNA(Ile)-lysidine synthase TilS/MesJ